jgi:uncharacterized membrane protein
VSQVIWLLPIHVLGAVVWLGSSLVLGSVGLYIRVSRRTGGVPPFARTLICVGRGLTSPAMAVVAGSGVWLVLSSSEWSFAQAWVIVGMVLVVVAAVGAVHLTRLATRMRDAAAGRATVTARLERLWLRGQAGLIAILVVALVDMAVKPGS